MPKPLNLFLRPPYGVWTVVHQYGQRSGTTAFSDLRLETSDPAFVKASCAGSLSINPPSRAMGRSPVIAPLAAGAAIPDRVSLYLNMQPLVGQPAFDRRASQILDVLGFYYEDLDGPSLEAGLGALLDSTVLGGTLTRRQVVEELLRGSVDVFVPGGHDLARAGIVTPPDTRQLAISMMCLVGPFDAVMCMDWMRDFVEEGQPEVDDLVAFAPWTWAIDPATPRATALAFTDDFTFPMPVLETLRTDFALTPAEWRQVGDNQKARYLERLRVRAGLGLASTEPPFEFNDPDAQNVFQLEAVAEFYANYHDPWSSVSVPRSRTAPAVAGNSATPAAGGWLELDGTPNLAFVEPNHDLIFLETSDHPSRTYRIIEVDAAAHRVRIEERDSTGVRHAGVPAAGSRWRIDPYQKLDFLDPAGVQATVAGSVITLDGTSDLTRIWPNASGANEPVYDTIVLDAIPQGQPRVFRILSSDPVARTVTVDGAPALPGADSAWRINLRPWIVLIDPFGGRLSGTAATVSAGHPDRVELDPAVALDRVNESFDTLYLPTDTRGGLPLRTYRILEVNAAGHWVRVNDNPTLAAPGPWHLQAGVSGELRGFAYDTGPGGARGWDHFDAMLFLLFNDAVRFSMRWSTYTSRDYPNYAQNRSTIRGNKAYEYLSYRSGRSSATYVPCSGGAAIGRPFRNYSLKVVDVNAGRRPGWAEANNGLFDGVREARWYFEPITRADVAAPPATPGANGKTQIRFHHSVHTGGASCSSAGCIVSPRYHQLRSRLARIYDDEVVALLGAHDPQIQKLFGLDQDDAIRLYEGCDAGGLTAANYNNKLVGRVWIIRPDERPLP